MNRKNFELNFSYIKLVSLVDRWCDVQIVIHTRACTHTMNAIHTASSYYWTSYFDRRHFIIEFRFRWRPMRHSRRIVPKAQYQYRFDCNGIVISICESVVDTETSTTASAETKQLHLSVESCFFFVVVRKRACAFGIHYRSGVFDLFMVVNNTLW